MSKASSQAPTRVRYGVLGFACALSMITYLDRVCFGSAMKDIVNDLGLTSVADLNFAASAFAFSYAAFEVPSGWLGDVFGPRKTLIRIVLWWSFFTALTGAVGLRFFGGTWQVPWLGMSFSLALMVLVRFLFGMGEAGAYPNITRALHNWFPFTERGLTQGTVWMSGRLMGGLTPIVWGLLVAGLASTASMKSDEEIALKAGDTITVKKGREVVETDGTKTTLTSDTAFKLAAGETVDAKLGTSVKTAEGTSFEIGKGDKYTKLYFKPLLPDWRSAFWLFGVLGVFWCIAFALWFRNRPDENPSVNEAELALIQRGGASDHAAHSGVPWLKIFSNRNLWILCFMYFCGAYGWYINITFLPSFLEDQFHVEKTSIVGMIYKGGPLLIGALGCLMGGYLTDWLVRRTGNQRVGRRIMGWFGHSLCAVCMFSCAYMPTAFTFFLAISFGGFFNDLTMGSSWSTCQDIGRKYAAIVAGCMNTIGNLGGVVAGIVTGEVLKAYQRGYAEDLGLKVENLNPEQLAAAMLPAYNLCFISFGVAYVLATFCWFLIDSTKPIAAGDEHK